MQLELQSHPLLTCEAAQGTTWCWKGAVEGKRYLIITLALSELPIQPFHHVIKKKKKEKTPEIEKICQY